MMIVEPDEAFGAPKKDKTEARKLILPGAVPNGTPPLVPSNTRNRRFVQQQSSALQRCELVQIVQSAHLDGKRA